MFEVLGANKKVNVEENSIKKILEAELANRKGELFETSLSRIMSHVHQAKEVGFAIMTSWRQSLSKKTNTTNFQALKQHVRSLGLGFIQLEGHWKECQDTDVPYEQCPPDKLLDSVEPSLMVFGIELEDAVKLGKMFDQDAVVYAGPETDGQTQLHFKDGTTLDLGQFNPQTIGQAYSTWKKKKEPGSSSTFTFEGYSYPAQSFVEKLTEVALRKKLNILEEAIREIKT